MFFNSTSVLLSRKRWNFFNHGAYHCLSQQSETDMGIDIYCLNDPEYLSTRYLALLEIGQSENTLDRLRSAFWSVWILSDRGNNE